MTRETDPTGSIEVETTDQTQLVLGSIVVLVACGTMVLHIAMPGGRSSVERSARVERCADGSEVVTWDEKVRYGVSGRLAGLIAGLIPRDR